MIAIGIFLSSLTESQVIASVSTLVVSVLLMVIDGFSSSNKLAGKVIGWISFQTRYAVFTKGIFDMTNALFFISVMVVFVFLTARKLESRRWS